MTHFVAALDRFRLVKLKDKKGVRFIYCLFEDSLLRHYWNVALCVAQHYKHTCHKNLEDIKSRSRKRVGSAEHIRI
jgi:hypothetical protein